MYWGLCVGECFLFFSLPWSRYDLQLSDLFLFIVVRYSNVSLCWRPTPCFLKWVFVLFSPRTPAVTWYNCGTFCMLSGAQWSDPHQCAQCTEAFREVRARQRTNETAGRFPAVVGSPLDSWTVYSRSQKVWNINSKAFSSQNQAGSKFVPIDRY